VRGIPQRPVRGGFIKYRRRGKRHHGEFSLVQINCIVMGSSNPRTSLWTNEWLSLVRSAQMKLKIGYQRTPALGMAVLPPAGYAAGRRRGRGAAAYGPASYSSYSVSNSPVLLKHRQSLAG
jgi:hypothetical protein